MWLEEETRVLSNQWPLWVHTAHTVLLPPPCALQIQFTLPTTFVSIRQNKGTCWKTSTMEMSTCWLPPRWQRKVWTYRRATLSSGTASWPMRFLWFRSVLLLSNSGTYNVDCNVCTDSWVFTLCRLKVEEELRTALTLWSMSRTVGLLRRSGSMSTARRWWTKPLRALDP